MNMDLARRERYGHMAITNSGRSKIMRKLNLAAVALALLARLAAPAAARSEPPTVFAAASLADAMEAAGKAYEEKTGNEIRFSFASSSTLARQIEAGAPAAIFASANETWMDYLGERDLIEAGTRISPISNALVLVAPADSELTEFTVTGDTDLAALLGPDGRLSVGDPDHVPAGIYARQSLQSLGQWETLEPRLARADDVRAALALVSRGEAPLGIVYSTDARISDEVKIVGRLPAESHTPITYPFAIVKGAGSEETRALFDFLTGEEALAIYAGFGFSQE